MSPAGRPRHAFFLLALWVIALLAYANSFRGALVFDSATAILKDPRIQEVTAHNARLIFTQYYWYNSPTGGLYRPLTTLSYLFNYAILGNGASPAGYHWLNFAIHAANTALVYLLALLIFEGAWPAFATAALWSLHPILTESVTNIVGRADLLAAFGVLAGLLCYQRACANSGSRRLRWLAALAMAAGIAIFSKENGVVLLAAIPLYWLAFTRRTPRRADLAAYGVAALPVLIYVMLRAAVFSRLPAIVTPAADNPLILAGFWTSRITAIKVLARYLWLLAWPVRLSCDYSYNQIPLSIDAQAVLALLILLALAVLAFFCYRRCRPVFFFVGFFFATLAPTSNLVIRIGTIMAERFLYLPAVGFAGCLVWLAIAGGRRWRAAGAPVRRAVPAVVAAVVLAYAARTFARNADWFDAPSLWTAAVAASPGSYKAHGNLAEALIPAQGADSDAVRTQFEQALAIMEGLPEEDRLASLYANLGFCYRIKANAVGQAGTAASQAGDFWYRKALDVLERGRRVDLACRRAVSRQNQLAGKSSPPSGWSPLYLALGRTYMHFSDSKKAIEAFEQGAAVDPSAQFFEGISSAWHSVPDPGKAAFALMEGVAMDAAAQPRLSAELAALYRETAPQSCALTGAGPNATINVQCPLVRDQLCAAYRNAAARFNLLRRPADAATAAATAITNFGCSAEGFR